MRGWPLPVDSGATMVQIVTYVGYRSGESGEPYWHSGLCPAAFIAILILSPSISNFIPSGLSRLFLRIRRTLWWPSSLMLYHLCKPILRLEMIFIAVLSFFAFFFQLNFVLIFVLAAVAGLFCVPRHLQPNCLSWKRTFGGKGKEYLVVVLLAAFIACIGALLSRGPQDYKPVPQSVQDRSPGLWGGFTAIPLIQYEMSTDFSGSVQRNSRWIARVK